MNIKTEEMKKKLENFFKSAFCVDGEVKITFDTDDFKISTIIELNDSDRGKFYIGKLEKKNDITK